MKIVSQSENSVLVLFEQKISPDVSQSVFYFTQLIQNELSNFIIDIVPSYASIMISFNLLEISHHNFNEILNRLMDDHKHPDQQIQNSQKNLIEIPVYYGEDVGFDLATIAQQSSLSIQQVIQLHNKKIYDVYALGFAPGFAYLGSVDEQIATPRKQTPRLTLPKGSVGIADSQTAIYPFDSPGGWNIIGRTPVDLVDYDQQPPCLMQVGDRIKFKPIEKEEYQMLGGEL